MTQSAAAVSPWDRARRVAFQVALRAGGALLVVVVVSLLAFALLQLAPGDAASAGAGESGITAEEYARAREQLGLDRPFLVQYGDWLFSAVQGDLGPSLANGQPVTSLIADRLPVTLSLTAAAVILLVPMAILLGVLAAAFENRWPDRLITAWTSVAVALPTFWFGLILVLFFAVQGRYLPATGYQPFAEDPGEWARSLVLPALTLAVPYSATLARQLRVSMTEVLASDYIRALEAKGLPWAVVVLKHGLRNAAPPTVTLFGLELIGLLGGAIVVESVFALPGVGSLAIQAVLGRDTTVIQGILVLTCLIAVVINLLVDMSYRMLNPRLRRA